jgi:phenylalanyl-tRNA synthetase alpha subunit
MLKMRRSTNRKDYIKTETKNKNFQTANPITLRVINNAQQILRKKWKKQLSKKLNQHSTKIRLQASKQLHKTKNHPYYTIRQHCKKQLKKIILSSTLNN